MNEGTRRSPARGDVFVFHFAGCLRSQIACLFVPSVSPLRLAVLGSWILCRERLIYVLESRFSDLSALLVTLHQFFNDKYFIEGDNIIFF